MLEDPRKTPFYSKGATVRVLFESIDDYDSTLPKVNVLVKAIRRQRDVRHVVLDTWNIVDYVLRKNLALIFGLNRFETSDFDPKYQVLPRSFDELLRLTEELGKAQRQLPSDPDPYYDLITFSGVLIGMLYEDNEFGNRFWALLVQYYQKYRPEAWKLLQSNPMPQPRKPQSVTGPARDFLLGLDKKWLEKARQLNKARNLAAHTMDSGRVARCFGILGPRTADLTRKHCFQMLKELVGVKKTA